jgi:hypothetical protein
VLEERRFVDDCVGSGGKVVGSGVGWTRFRERHLICGSGCAGVLQPRNVTELKLSLYVGLDGVRHHSVLLVYRKRLPAFEVSINQRRRVMFQAA